ncbi:MAG: DUF2460 domain-containing protein [Terriglobales bacterium]
MSNLLFPRVNNSLDWEVTLVPLFETGNQESKSGREVRARFRQYPRWEIALKYVVLRTDPATRDENGQTQMEKLLSFFGQMGGSFDDFLFNLTDVTGNDADSQIVGQPIGTGDGATTAFQLVRPVMGLLDICQEPLNQVATVYVNGAKKTQGTDYTVAKGIVTFGAAPAAAAAITADFTALWRCRFNTPEASSRRSNLSYDLGFRQFFKFLWEHKQQALSLITVKT